jgi:hypothetical protein
MLDDNAADFTLRVQVQERVFIEVARFRYVRRSKPNVERVSVLEVAGFSWAE